MIINNDKWKNNKVRIGFWTIIGRFLLKIGYLIPDDETKES